MKEAYINYIFYSNSDLFFLDVLQILDVQPWMIFYIQNCRIYNTPLSIKEIFTLILKIHRKSTRKWSPVGSWHETLSESKVVHIPDIYSFDPLTFQGWTDHLREK